MKTTPNWEHGFWKAISGLFVGLVLSLIISSVLTSMYGETGRSIAVLINLVLIMVGISQLGKANYWSLSYCMGYLLGILLLGNYLMESWEMTVYAVAIGGFAILKILRKMKIPLPF